MNGKLYVIDVTNDKLLEFKTPKEYTRWFLNTDVKTSGWMTYDELVKFYPEYIRNVS